MEKMKKPRNVCNVVIKIALIVQTIILCVFNVKIILCLKMVIVFLSQHFNFQLLMNSVILIISLYPKNFQVLHCFLAQMCFQKLQTFLVQTFFQFQIILQNQMNSLFQKCLQNQVISPVLCRIQIVIDSGKHHIMANQSAVADKDSSLILKPAAGINEDPLSHVYILAAICIERREQSETFMHLSAGKLRHQRHYFLIIVISCVELKGQADSLLTQFMHLCKYRRPRLDGLAGIHYVDKFFCCHYAE